MLFVREDVVEAAWSIVEPILGNVAQLREHDPGTWGPAEGDLFTANVGGWHNREKAR
jgi:glucose-6-phosphate 1-dehydrogenase